MLHMQHHFLCNISYVVIAESMGKSLKYTTSKHIGHTQCVKSPIYSHNEQPKILQQKIFAEPSYIRIAGTLILQVYFHQCSKGHHIIIVPGICSH